MASNNKILGLSSRSGKPVPLKSINVSVGITGYVAEVRSQLSYSNEESDPIEASFTFPVDDGSAVFQFEAFIKGRHLVAEIQEREQAKLTYEDAKASGKTAVLLKEDAASGDVFQCMLGNLPPHTEATLTMAYVIELPQEPDGTIRFTLPTVLNPRYSPDVGGLTAAEGATYTPPTSIAYNFKMAAIVKGYHKVASVTSDKLQLNVQLEDAGKKAVVSLGEEFKFDHDLSLYVKYAEPYKPQVVMENGLPEKEGLLKEDMLMVSFYPDLQNAGMTNLGEYIFVIDRSGSMGGNRMKNAKEALLLFLKSLPDGCYFNIVSFGSRFDSLFPDGCKKYSKETLKQAMSLQESMGANYGGTEIFNPLENIFKSKCQQHPRSVFLLTDGEVGNTDQVISLVKKNAAKFRVFALGIGEGVSTSLIKGVVRAGNGVADFISDNQRTQPKVVRLLKCAMQPSLSGVEVDWSLPPGVTPMSIPAELPSLMTVGERLTLYAMLQGVDSQTVYSPSSVTIKGITEDKPVSYKLEFQLSDDSFASPSAPVHRLATKEQIKILQDEEAFLCNLEEDPWQSIRYDTAETAKKIGQLREQIVDVSRHGNIVSKFSSFVAVDKGGAKVEGELKQRDCPVPTLSEDFMKGLQDQYEQDMSSQLCVEFGGDCASPRSMSYGFCATTSSPRKKKKARMTSFNFGIGEKIGSLVSGTKDLFSRKSKKSASKRCYRGESVNSGALPAAMNEALSVDCDELASPPPAPSALGGSNVPAPPPPGASRSSGDIRSQKGKMQKKGDADSVMLEVISLQEIQGHWKHCAELPALIGVPDNDLKSSDMIKEQDVWVTLVVVAWLRKKCAQRRDEWEMIEMKAINWLGKQKLEDSVEGWLKTVTTKFWP